MLARGLGRVVRRMRRCPRNLHSGITKLESIMLNEQRKLQLEAADNVRDMRVFENNQQKLVATPMALEDILNSDKTGNQLCNFKKLSNEHNWSGYPGIAGIESNPHAHIFPSSNLNALDGRVLSLQGSRSDSGRSCSGRFMPSSQASRASNLNTDSRNFSSAVSVVEGVDLGQLDEIWSQKNRLLARNGTVKGIAQPLRRNFGSLQSNIHKAKYEDSDDSEDDALGPKTTSPSTNKHSQASHLSQSRFDAFNLSALSIRALHETMGYERMTFVQEATLPVILGGKDVLAKAKTGTGKTIAFLLPAIEGISRECDKVFTRDKPIEVLVICPARELAMQAASEAAVLLKHHKGLGVQVVIGGTSMSTETTKLRTLPCQVLVATPGRLIDHIENTVGFVNRLKGLRVLVLDEADRLLDMGFRNNILSILRVLPKERQSLLFSATIPKEVRSMSQIALKPDHKFIDTVGQEDETHSLVKQQYLIVAQDKNLSVIYSLLNQHIEKEPAYKVLVFCTTANITAFMAQLFTKLGLNIREIHSRKSQTYRTRVSDEFRKSKGQIIMFTSDVSARGVDYPDVTFVLQVGLPSNREQYIHRLGRTGRAGKEGEGMLLLLPWEKPYLSKLKDLSITAGPIPEISSTVHQQIWSALSKVDNHLQERAYQSWLGYYSTCSLDTDKRTIVQMAAQFSSSIGMDEPPILNRNTIRKMGLSHVL